MTAWNADEAARLAAEMREDDERAAPGSWSPGAGWLGDSVVNGGVSTPRRPVRAYVITDAGRRVVAACAPPAEGAEPCTP